MKELASVRLEKFSMYIKHHLATNEMNDAEFSCWMTSNLNNLTTEGFGQELDSLGDFILQQKDILVKSEQIQEALQEEIQNEKQTTENLTDSDDESKGNNLNNLSVIKNQS